MMKPVRIYHRWWRYKSYLPDATLPAHTVECPDCGCRMDIPTLRQGQEAHCPVCNHEVVEVENNPYIVPLAYALTSLILMAFAYSMVYVRVDLFGVTSILSLPQMMRLLISLDYGFLAEVMFVLTFGAPLLFLLLCLYVYTALVRERAYPALRFATRILVRLRHWIMVDVFFISTLVAYIKLSSVAVVEFGSAFYLMFPLSVMLIRTSVSIPQHWVYYKIHRLTGGHAVQTASEDKICCSRCLYFPANILPIMISSNPTALEINTIFNGIVYMWNDGDRMIAVIIFSASIMVPVLKIIAMAVLIASAYFKPPMSAAKMSVLYRITESIGRWSMIDIFVIIILMSAFHTNMARVVPGGAAVYFCLVVILTMLSAYYFDPRLIWDRQQQLSDGLDSSDTRKQ